MIESVRESARFAPREPRSSLVLIPLMDAAVAAETISHTAIVSAIRERATAFGKATGEVRNDLRESARILGAAFPLVRAQRDTRERIAVSGRATTSATSVEDVRESGALGDATYSAPPCSDALDVARLGDRAVPRTLRRAAVREGVSVRGHVSTQAGMLLRSTARALDRTTQSVRHRLAVREAFAASDAAQAVTQRIAGVREALRVRDTVTPRTIHRPSAHERAFVGDRIDDRTDIAWTANTLTWAMSRYEGFGFESIASGFAVAADGVYVPSRDGSVPWRLVTGKMDFGDSAKKRMTNCYTVGEHETPLVVKIGADVRGQWQTFDYAQTSEPADNDRGARNKVGQGFSSTFYQFVISGEELAMIHRAEAMIQKTQRRV